MARAVPVWSGRVKAGKVEWDRRAEVTRYIHELEGQPVEITIRKPQSKRSLAQNKWWWSRAVALLADELGYDRDEREQLHYALLMKCFGSTTVAGEQVPKVGSSELSTAEFSTLMEWVVRFAARELRVVIPLPSENWPEDGEAA